MKRLVLLVVAFLLATGGLAQRFSLDFEASAVAPVINAVVEEAEAVMIACPADLAEANQGSEFSCAYTESILFTQLEDVRSQIDFGLWKSGEPEVALPWTAGEGYIMKGVLSDGKPLLIVLFEESPRGNFLFFFLWED